MKKPAAKTPKLLKPKTTTAAKKKLAAKPPKAKATLEKREKLGKFKRVSKNDAQESMRLLRERYPDADCELIFKNAFELLISVILSAQTTDANVNRATPNLFKRFPTPKALAEADLDEIKSLVKSTGYFNSKATNIQACARALVERFNGEIPTNLHDLTTLPGVGRKTANVLLGVAFDVPGWTVDTHVQRLSYRLGFSEQTDPAKIETDLQKLFPERDWTKDSITLIWHGRRCCYARTPDCPACPVNHLCPSSLV